MPPMPLTWAPSCSQGFQVNERQIFILGLSCQGYLDVQAMRDHRVPAGATIALFLRKRCIRRENDPRFTEESG